MSAPTTNPPDPKPPKKKRAPNWLPLKEEQLAMSWLHKLCNTQKWLANCNTELASSSVGVLSDTINQESNHGNLSSTLLGFSTPTVQLASSIACPIGQKAAKKQCIDDAREGSSSTLFAKVAQEQLAAINATNNLTKAQNNISCKQLVVE
ncbi:hypothetical protein PCASD_03736 [Puccinia coronata f. sp. avenae]|uniref:No apical meristem-associated C-terminal domain-containing protein n=1 Tax=Puccinia coronata f. sp. avenae TaxID=200324 RepID=A0A2N5V8D5_9BASI|nr:hypothetical protein PCASD_03736 [Puccinia coronata f. sp. avenae]